jgi:hypothetical protein
VGDLDQRRGILRRPSNGATQLGPVFADVEKSTKPFVWLGTLAECIAAVATLASKIPIWTISGLLVGIPAVTFAVVQLRRANFAIRQVEQLYNYDRKYIQFNSRWTFGRSDDPNYWSAINYTVREFICLKPVRRWEWDLTRRSDKDVPFGNVVLRNRNATRSGDGTCVFRDPHLTISKFKFFIEFDPPLRVGESATVSFEAVIPTHKVATLELLRQRIQPSLPAPADCDFSSVKTSFPIDDLLYEVVFPECLGSRRHGLQVVERQNEYVEEKASIDADNMFTISRLTVDDNVPAWKMSLHRKLPPIGTTYRIVWEPPSAPHCK